MGRARRFGVCHLAYRTHLTPLTETTVPTPQLGSHMPVNSSRSLKSPPASRRSQNLQASPQRWRCLAGIAASDATSFPGMLAGAMLIGTVESITATFYGPSWAPAVAFGFCC